MDQTTETKDEVAQLKTQLAQKEAENQLLYRYIDFLDYGGHSNIIMMDTEKDVKPYPHLWHRMLKSGFLTEKQLQTLEKEWAKKIATSAKKEA